MKARRRILYVEQNTDGTVGGSHYCLLDTIRHLDRRRFDPLVVFYREHALIEEFRGLCPTFVTPVRDGVNLAARVRPNNTLLGGSARLVQKGINLFRCIIPSFAEKVRLLRMHRVGLVHLNNAVNSGFDWTYACDLVGARCITHNRALFSLTATSRFFIKRFDAVVSVSGFLRDELERQGLGGGDRAIVINDGIDPQELEARVRRAPAEVRRELGLAPQDPVIGVVGNIRELKGQEVVVEAVRVLRESYPTLRCLVIGGVSDRRSRDREYFRSLEQRVERYGLREHVLFLGFRKDVPDLVRSLDILVQSSIQPEAFGRVILEGMVLERPVIATSIGGPLEIIEDRVSGFLVPPADAPALAETIGALLADASLRGRIALAGKRRAVEHFHISRNIERMHDLYERLLPVRS